MKLHDWSGLWFHTVFCLIKASQEEVTMVPSFVVSRTLGEPWCEALCVLEGHLPTTF